MRTVRTVLGVIPAETLGVCSSHEHILLRGAHIAAATPQVLLDDPEIMSREVAAWKAAGGGALVDAMPMDGGSQVTDLAAISRATGVHILACTGFHKALYYPQDHWMHRADPEPMAAAFISEIGKGAGLIKAATERPPFTRLERTVLQAAALAQRESGAPILTHTEGGAGAREQLDLLESSGADLSSVLLSHMDRNPDPAVHLAAARRGAFLQYDYHLRDDFAHEEGTLALIRGMLEAGLGGRLLLGCDLARKRYFPSYGGGPGYAYLLDRFRERLADPAWSLLMIANPAQALSREDTHG